MDERMAFKWFPMGGTTVKIACIGMGACLLGGLCVRLGLFPLIASKVEIRYPPVLIRLYARLGIRTSLLCKKMTLSKTSDVPRTSKDRSRLQSNLSGNKNMAEKAAALDSTRFITSAAQSPPTQIRYPICTTKKRHQRQPTSSAHTSHARDTCTSSVM